MSRVRSPGWRSSSAKQASYPIRESAENAIALSASDFEVCFAALLFTPTACGDLLLRPAVGPLNLTSMNPVMGLARLLPVAD